jgi:hypothetical protein
MKNRDVINAYGISTINACSSAQKKPKQQVLQVICDQREKKNLANRYM